MSDKANLPAEGSTWRAKDGRIMRLSRWLPDWKRSKPTAMMEVLNPGPKMRRFTEQGIDSFGCFLQPESNVGSDGGIPDGWTRGSLAAAQNNATTLFDHLGKITMLERAQCSVGIGFVKRMKLTNEYRDSLAEAEALLERIAIAKESEARQDEASGPSWTERCIYTASETDGSWWIDRVSPDGRTRAACGPYQDELAALRAANEMNQINQGWVSCD